MSSITLLRRKVGDLIKEICEGNYVLPHFQRKYVWGEEEIGELLDSIRGGLYIGAPVVVPYSNYLAYMCLPGVNCVGRLGNSPCNPCSESEAGESYAEDEDDVNSPAGETWISGETSYDFPQSEERDTSTLENESTPQGVKSSAPHTPKYFVLDGQQRLATIFYLFNCETIAKCPHTSRPDGMKFVIFVNIYKVDRSKSIDEYIEIVPFSSSKRSKYASLVADSNYITLEGVYEAYLSSGKSSKTFCDILSKKKGINSRDLLQNLWDFFSALHDYELDIVEITHLSDIGMMALLFDRINRTGVELSLSDLAVAYFHSGFGLDLRKLWKKSAAHTTKLSGLPNSLQISEFEKEFDPVLLVLRIMSHMLGKSIKKGDLLSNFDPKTLSYEGFMTRWAEAVDYLVEAIQRLHNSYGVYSYKALPNKVTLRLLAAFLYIVDTHAPDKRETKIPTCGITLDEFIDFWYWTSVFTGRYSKESSPTSEKDTGDFLAFIKSLSSGKSLDLPSFCHNPPVHLNLFKVTKDKDNYISRAILNLVYLRYLGRPSGLPTIDWFLEDGDLNEVDHIFPVSKGRGSKDNKESILNKTLVTATTNKSKSGKLPSQLIKDMRIKDIQPETVSLILNCHFINSNAEKAMNSDNYDDFIRERNDEIIKYINKNIFGKCSCCKINVIS